MITVINTTDKSYSKNDYSNKDIQLFNSKTMNIKHCIGCFGCWVKNPGLCIQKDDMPIILEAVIHSKLVVFITEVKAGLISSECKRINDKLLPLLMPYIGIFSGEMHHQKRYDKYPDIGLVMMDDENLNDEVFDINKNIYQRMAINFHSNLLFAIRDNDTLGGLKHEINNY